MITKEIAMSLSHGDELHFTGKRECKREVGPRGGVKEYVTRVRISGQCKTWVRTPERFRVPVKHGMYENGEINESNGDEFHLAEDCPLIGSENTRIVKKLVRETEATIKREGLEADGECS